MNDLLRIIEVPYVERLDYEDDVAHSLVNAVKFWYTKLILRVLWLYDL